MRRGAFRRPDQGAADAAAAGGAPRLNSLTGLRAVAAFGVFLTHANENFFSGAQADRVVEVLFNPGFTGVSFFFVLSGFVLTWSHQPGDTPRAFYRRRFARVAPAYWVALLAGIVLTMVVQGGWRPLWVALPSFLGLQAWIPRADVYWAGNAVGWTLSCELFFYLVFPLAVRFLPTRRTFQALVASVLVLVTVGPGLVWSAVAEPPDYLQIFPVQRLPEFLLGMVVAAAIRSGWRPPISFGWSVVLAAAAYVTMSYLDHSYLAAAVPYGLVIACAVTRDLTGRGTLLGRRWPRRLGELSFAFYLVHQLVVRVVDRIAPEVGSGWWVAVGATLLSLAGAVGAAVLLYSRVEEPLERRLRKAPPRPDVRDATVRP
ncbi:acyltransferase [Modestobacter muralis]|uniref:Acyltransferase n=1 Tax=Modestobacter muralis TaxID=1608614 RepID=A0A6P0HDZ8_9ACTN|nr:acyltransferase [Modestobacter muralis]NEK96456.1 acyltransferase [Modestobacter muralis]NEN53356.1 acyltransferase [Modestobacter muralis]